MKFKHKVALVIGLVMVLAFLLFVRGVVLIIDDYSRPEVSKGENTVGLVIVLLLAGVSLFEAYRFLSFFNKERRARRSLRHFN